MFDARDKRGPRMGGWTLFAVAALSLAALSGVIAGFSQGEPQSGSSTAVLARNQNDPPAETVFKNIQVLKGMPASQLRDVMGLIASSLGVRCDQCHVPDAFEKDDKRAKQTARQMIRMTMNINTSTFEGETQVTCYSCHRGHERPIGVPPIALATQAVPEPEPERRAPASDLPTFDQIADKYLQAVGSASAFEKLKSCVMKGAITDARGDSYPVEVSQTAQGKFVQITTTPAGSSSEGYDGTAGWISGPRGTSELKGADLLEIKRNADIARPLKIREEALSPRVFGRVTVGDKQAYLVAGRADGQRVQLFFDVQTGLLLRRLVMRATILGAFPEQTDFEDYREVDGVELPFVIRRSTPNPGARSTIVWKEIVHNTPLDDARFNPPVVQK